MVICITGDVHQSSADYDEHRRGFAEEWKQASRYRKILAKHGLKNTFYVTGKCLDEEPEFWKEVAKDKNVEIGGHTYHGFDNYPLGKGFLLKILAGCSYGFKGMQEKDIKKNMNAAKAVGVNLVSWRTHEYQSNKTTKDILVRYGFTSICDRFKDVSNPSVNVYKGKLVDLPLTVPDDHNTMKHSKMGDDRKGMMSPDEWLEMFKKSAKENAFTIVQLHPNCMHAIDDFEMFGKLCKWISDEGLETSTIRDFAAGQLKG